MEMVMEFIEGQEEMVEADDEQADGHPQCQSQDVDDGEALVLSDVSDGGLEIAFYHDDAPQDMSFDEPWEGDEDLAQIPEPAGKGALRTQNAQVFLFEIAEYGFMIFISQNRE